MAISTVLTSPTHSAAGTKAPGAQPLSGPVISKADRPIITPSLGKARISLLAGRSPGNFRNYVAVSPNTTSENFSLCGSSHARSGVLPSGNSKLSHYRLPISARVCYKQSRTDNLPIIGTAVGWHCPILSCTTRLSSRVNGFYTFKIIETEPGLPRPRFPLRGTRSAIIIG